MITPSNKSQKPKVLGRGFGGEPFFRRVSPDKISRAKPSKLESAHENRSPGNSSTAVDSGGGDVV
jgi:hypothetical protein